jgi:hypothetical protein
MEIITHLKITNCVLFLTRLLVQASPEKKVTNLIIVECEPSQMIT